MSAEFTRRQEPVNATQIDIADSLELLGTFSGGDEMLRPTVTQDSDMQGV
jgi:hypothetical protein